MQDAKEDVRTRLNLEDVIGEYVSLKRAGRNFKGLSPFTAEKTPSFVVSPDKHIWHDFSSNKGGDLFSFVMEVEGMDFRQALEHLARKAGVDLSMYDSGSSKEFSQRKKRLLEAHDLAASYYQQSLLKNPHALEYVFKVRRFDKTTVSEFRIGYAPDSGDALTQFLIKKGFSKKELADGGLTNRFGSDMFRGRLVVPLMDAVGQVIGFTARILVDQPNAPKYLNTTQTLLYDKGRHVFGLSQAKEAIRKNDFSVIVEGNLDVVASHQAGVKQVVATAGTAMTEHQLKALARLSGNVRLAYDGDKAGIAATERSIPIAQITGAALTIVSLPEGVKDPDELVQKDPKLWVKAIEDSQPVIDWVLQQYLSREDVSTAAGKRAFTSAALSVVELLDDAVEKEHYQSKIAQLIGSSLEAVKAKQDSFESKPSASKNLKSTNHDTKFEIDEFAYQDNLLAVGLIDTPSQELFGTIESSIFGGENRRAVAEYIKNHVGTAITSTPDELKEIDTYVKILLLKADIRYADWSNENRYFETAALLRQIATQHKRQQKDKLTNQLRDAEEFGDDTQAGELRIKINQLIKEISSAKKR